MGQFTLAQDTTPAFHQSTVSRVDVSASIDTATAAEILPKVGPENWWIPLTISSRIPTGSLLGTSVTVIDLHSKNDVNIGRAS